MKNWTKGIVLVMCSGLTLFGCRPDNVRPSEQGEEPPVLSGSVSDPHPALDFICGMSDTMFLIREDDGSPVINKCFGFGGIPITCPPDQKKWGGLVLIQGYFNNVNYIDCNFSMAPGWYCDFNNWDFGVANSFQFDSLGLPVVGTDWGTQIVAPAQNRWQLRIPVDTLPSPCFEVALRVNALKLSLFGGAILGSQTVTWGSNRNWNSTSHPEASPSQWLMHFCPDPCLDNVPVQNICKTVYTATGATSTTCSGNDLNCITLHPTANYPGQIAYSWPDQISTQDLVVCPTVNTTYSVTISADLVPMVIVNYNVNVVDASCTAETPLVALDFCTTNLNLRYGNVFNIRDYIRFYNGGVITGNQWNQVYFTYTAAGANSPTVPSNWNLAAFNAGSNVTIVPADYNIGTGNVARGQYRLFVYRKGRTTYDDYITIRVNNGQVSTVNSAKCANIVGGPVCTVPASSNGGAPVPGIHVCYTPPANPNLHTTDCVPIDNVNDYVSGTCTGTGSGISGYLIGACFTDPCQ